MKRPGHKNFNAVSHNRSRPEVLFLPGPSRRLEPVIKCRRFLSAVILNPSVCDVCVFHSAVFGEMKLFAVLWFLVWSFSDLNLAC